MEKELSIWGYFEKCVVQSYANFEGRARRKEYWSFRLVFFVLAMSLNLLCGALARMADMYALGFIPLLFVLALFLPDLAVMVRRLHDVGRSGWWVLISFTIVGIFLLLYWFIKEGDQGPNQYGEDPKQIA